MDAFYCGLNEFGLLNINGGQASSDPTIVSPSLVDLENISNIVLDLGLVLYQRNGDSSWYSRGLNSNSEILVFLSNLQISNLTVCKSKVFGLSINNNLVYESSYKFNSLTKELEWSSPQIVEIHHGPWAEGSSWSLRQITSSDSNFYLLDSQSHIYSSSTLIWTDPKIIIKRIALGFEHGLALTDTGAVYSWGNGSRGQLGHPEILYTVQDLRRIEFFDDLESIIVEIECGGWHSLALTSDGDIYSWGWNESGQLGHSEGRLSQVTNDPYPIDLGSGENPVIGIGAGSRHSVVLLNNGQLYSFGWSKYGQLGVGDRLNRMTPTEVRIPHDRIVVKFSCVRWGTIIYTINKSDFVDNL